MIPMNWPFMGSYPNQGVNMKIKALLTTLVGAIAINGAVAGEWCPPAPDKCPVECCPDSGGSIGVGYGSDYIWNGVRFLRDHFYGDVNYSFQGLPVTPTIGVTHVTGLGSNFAGLGVPDIDWTQAYVRIGLPEMLGACASIEYRQHFFANLRAPSGTPGNIGDSFSEISLRLEKEIFNGLCAYYDGSYHFGGTPFALVGGVQLGDWFHEAGVTKSLCLTDTIGLDLKAGVGYTDSLWSGIGLQSTGSGWNHYFIEAAAPIGVGSCATLTPYIGYNGTPDGWKGDGTGTALGLVPGANYNDVLHWGVRFGVDF